MHDRIYECYIKAENRNMVKTSIIVPVYNTADYLKECFESIFNQTQKEIEIIVINDGSTDDSLHILEEIKKEHPEIKIFSQDNQGLGNSRNKGIDLATGEFIYFMDSDDCLADNALECCYQYAKDYQLDVLMFDAETFGNIKHDDEHYNRTKIISDQEIVLNGEYFAERYWLKRFIPSACLIYTSAQFIKINKLKFLPKIYYEDNEFHIKLLSLAKRVMYIPQSLYKRRYRKFSITTNSFDMRHAKDCLKMIQAIGIHNYSDRLYIIVQELQLNFLKSLYKKCITRDLLKDESFIQELYNTALDICGGSIKAITRLSDIDILYQIIYSVSENIFSEKTKKNIQKRRKEIAKDIFTQIPLKLAEKYVGIYGTGRNTERFLNVYQKNVSDIRANIIFINTIKSLENKQYKGYDIFDVNNIGELPLDCIVIASVKYESEMYEIIKEKYGKRFKVIRLKTDLQF